MMVVLFSNGLNLALIASWGVHTEIHEKNQQLSHLEFLRNVTQLLLQMRESMISRPGPKTNPPIETRVTDDHYLIPTTQGRYAQCKSQSLCCDKRLHVNCFAIYLEL